MKERNISLWKIFIGFLKISSFTFGGGYTIIPVIKDEFSKKRNLIEEDEMLKIVAIAQSGPGALAINCSILTGYRLRSFKGALVAMLGSSIPSIVVITLLSFFYKQFKSNEIIGYALMGMSGAISAVLLLTTYDLFKAAVKENLIFSLAMMAFAFVASFFFSLNISVIILILGLSGLLMFTINKEAMP